MANSPKPIFDKAAAEDFLDFQRMNIRLNELTREFEVSGLPEEYKADKLNCFFTLAYDTVRQTCSTTRAHADDLFKLIGTSDRKSTRLNSSHYQQSRMPSSA